MSDKRNHKPPAFQFYAADWLSDEQVSLLSLSAEGAYIRLLAYCWREGSIPEDRVAIRSLCKHCDETIIDEVLQFFVPHPRRPRRLTNKRLAKEKEKVEQYRKSQSESGLRGAEIRWGDGGRAHSDPIRVAIQPPMAKNSSSTSISKYLNLNIKLRSLNLKEPLQQCFDVIKPKTMKSCYSLMAALKWLSGRSEDIQVTATEKMDYARTADDPAAAFMDALKKLGYIPRTSGKNIKNRTGGATRIDSVAGDVFRRVAK